MADGRESSPRGSPRDDAGRDPNSDPSAVSVTVDEAKAAPAAAGGAPGIAEPRSSAVGADRADSPRVPVTSEGAKTKDEVLRLAAKAKSGAPLRRGGGGGGGAVQRAAPSMSRSRPGRTRSRPRSLSRAGAVANVSSLPSLGEGTSSVPALQSPAGTSLRTEAEDLRDAPQEPVDPSFWATAAAIWTDTWKHHNEPVNPEPTLSTIVCLTLFYVFAAPFLFLFASSQHKGDNRPGWCCLKAPLCGDARTLHSRNPFRIMFMSWAVVGVTVFACYVPFWATVVDVVAILTTYVALCFTGAVEEAFYREAARQQQRRQQEEDDHADSAVSDRAMDARVAGGTTYFKLLELYVSESPALDVASAADERPGSPRSAMAASAGEAGGGGRPVRPLAEQRPASKLVSSWLALQRESLHFLIELFLIKLNFRMTDQDFSDVNAARFAMELIGMSRQRAESHPRHKIWSTAGKLVAVLILAGRFLVEVDTGDAAMFEGFSDSESDAGSIILATLYLSLLLGSLCWMLPLLFQTFGRVVDASVQERYIFLVLCRAVEGECEPYSEDIVGAPDLSRMAWSNVGLRATVHLYLWTKLVLEKRRQLMNRTLGCLMGFHALGSAMVLFRTVSSDVRSSFTFHWAVILLAFTVYTTVVCDVINEGHRANSAHGSLLRQTREMQVQMAMRESVSDRGREIRKRIKRRNKRAERLRQEAEQAGRSESLPARAAAAGGGSHLAGAPAAKRRATERDDDHDEFITPGVPDPTTESTLANASADTTHSFIVAEEPAGEGSSGIHADELEGIGQSGGSSEEAKSDSSLSDLEIIHNLVSRGTFRQQTSAYIRVAKQSLASNPKPHAVESFGKMIETSGAAASFFGVELRRGLLLSYVSASVSLLTLCFARLDFTDVFDLRW